MVYNLALKKTCKKTLSSRCGIPERTLERIGASTTYRNLRIQVIDAFLAGCGIKLTRRGIICSKAIKEKLVRILRSRNGFPNMNSQRRALFDERCGKLLDK